MAKETRTDVEVIRSLWHEANALTREAEEKKAEANAKAAEYDLHLTRALRKRNCPPGYMIDIHGDGTLKPIAECAKPGAKK